jgi:hypothetical protein
MHNITPTEDRELTLDSYVLHINTQVCITCGSCERYSMLFECWVHPKKKLTRLSRVDGQALKKLPLAHVNQPQRSIPMCTKCVGQFESVDQTPIPPCSPEAWQETLRRKYAEESKPATVKVATRTPTRAVPNLEDL